MFKYLAADVAIPGPGERMVPGLRALPPPGGDINPVPPPSHPIVTPPPPPAALYPPTVTTPDNTVLIILVSVVIVAGFVASFLVGYFLAKLQHKNPVEQNPVFPRTPVTGSDPLKS